MRSAIEGYEDFGFTLTERICRRFPAVMITDTDFADDIALISDNLDIAGQSLLEHVETAATEVGLHITTSKTEYKLAYNLRQQGNLTTLDNSKLRKVDDFKYLSSWIDQTKKDLEICKGEAWSASNKLTAVWKSNLSRDLKICFPRASVESVLLNRSESWTLRLLLWKNNLMAATQGCYVLL